MALSPAARSPSRRRAYSSAAVRGKSSLCPRPPTAFLSNSHLQSETSPHAQGTKRIITMGPFRQETILTHGRNGFVTSRPTRPFSVPRPYYENSNICPTITTHPSQVFPKENVAYGAEQLRVPSYRHRLSIWPCLHDSIRSRGTAVSPTDGGCGFPIAAELSESNADPGAGHLGLISSRFLSNSHSFGAYKGGKLTSHSSSAYKDNACAMTCPRDKIFPSF